MFLKFSSFRILLQDINFYILYVVCLYYAGSMLIVCICFFVVPNFLPY